MNRTVSLAIRLATACCLGALALMHHPLPAWARPGTPNNVKVYPCGPRAICVEFDNTATEKVRIETEMNKNDRRLAKLPPSQPECMFRGGHGRGAFFCTPLGSNTECRTGDNIYEGGNILGQGRRVVGTCLRHIYQFSNLEAGANYCLRFRARNVSDQLVSQIWTGWNCARPERDPPPQAKPYEPSTTTYFRLTTAFRYHMFLAPISKANNSLTRLEQNDERTSSQYWSASKGDGGGFRLHSAVHGRDDCLELVRSGSDNNQPRISKCETFGDDVIAQHWTFKFMPNKSIQIQSKARPDLCLDIINGGARNNQPQLTKCGNTTGQKWEVRGSEKRVR